jgi:hypothetical protein
MARGDLQAPLFKIRNTNPLARCGMQILGKGEIHMIATLTANEEWFFITLSLLILVFIGWVVWKS